jgi:hypothetical protein
VKVRFFFSVLQSKALCEEVPESFIQETLEKHRDQLSSPHPGVSSETLEVLRERGRDFGRRVAKYYKPTKGFIRLTKQLLAFPVIREESRVTLFIITVFITLFRV